MSDLKVSDNALVMALALAAAVAIASLAYCTSVERRANAELDKARVEAGLCVSAWGTWSKCK